MTDDYETHELEMAFKAGAASRDSEIHRLQMALADTEQLELGTAERCDQLRNQVTLLRDALTKERDQLCEDVTMLREALRDCAYDEGGFCINPDAAEALAATEPKP